MNRWLGFFLPLLVVGCKSKVDELQEQAAAIVFIVMILMLGYLALTPKLQKWTLSKLLVQFFVFKVASVAMLLMIVVGCYLLFNDDPIAYLLSLNLFISSALLYRLKRNYTEKSESERLVDFRYFTITLPTQLALVFLLNDGLKQLF